MKTESMIKRSFQLTVLLSIILGIVSCNYITGEGPIVEKKMTVERFSGVELDGSFDVNIDQGMVQSVTVKGHENIIDELRLNVMDNVLYISLEPGSYINYELGVNITIPDLKLARLLGSGDIQLGTFVGLSSVNLEIDGSGDIETKEESVLEVNDKASVKLEAVGITILC